MTQRATVETEHTDDERDTPDHLVVVIGAGIGGIGAGIALRRAGIDDFVIVERSDDIGGTWHSNQYPDVAVDIPGIVYQFSFEKNPYWSRTFPKGAEVKAYIDRCANKYGIRSQLRLKTEVLAREWDEGRHLWRLRLDNGETLTARFVITALGAFVEPKKPDIPGLDDFAGTVIQTQRWDHSCDLTGKRVAIIGTGATAVQVIPQVARVAAQLDVYQRRAIWVFAKPDFRIPRFVQHAFRKVPLLQTSIRGVAAACVELGLVGITVYGKQIAPLALLPAWATRAFLFTQVRDRALRRKLTPDYGFGCKRPSVSNHYYRTFTRSNVDLITSGVASIDATGITDTEGIHRQVDVLILATGFEMSQSPAVFRKRPVKGRDGFDLADFYEHERAKAYEGVSMPQLPNTFMIFGPYAWSGSSWHVMVENATRHAIRVIQEAGRRGATAVSVRPEANDRFYDFIRPRATDTLMHGKACANANSYYIDHHGDFSFLRPTTAYQSTRASKTFPLDDYRYEQLG
ncbi:Predicted flavoprotein CzcO associated with the cation diffusion facilitator CzcD [Nocardia farcinica]|uniref:flavin-containing monooxygenase n=1 Tax=Nocardia farcinica TaxID=37329 RepID=UPI00095509A3|nr:NAD(P)/FAD-dependent oxidoreductase [Nocardia farcinica]MBA4859204.1 NAD(P)/FAD-dependent oxidoreductase [Nocardia farcinica]MBC9819014.1 NAD(P)/FAD-dependent oxidoreductase [Nocardia farcinica]PFW98756.1 Baeyer-Villiger monooxygenase [Nocardia farcinica]PFX04377.1 Baeyer-Villiger monooxygenase [Nocardia farcinica]SIT34190.1 Predicted flavoprotein CzcO associated with the cation diffusion facilitator CzcD [Nocardia farcinica]